MDKFLRIFAYLGNAALLMVAVLLIVKHARYMGMLEFFCLFLLGVLPILNMWVLWQGPDREERKLRRLVAKAELRQKLRAIERLETQAGDAGQPPSIS